MATDKIVRALQNEYQFQAFAGPTSVRVEIAERWEQSREARRLANALGNLGIGNPLITETCNNRGRCDITVSGVVDEMLAPKADVVGPEMVARVMAPIAGEAPKEPGVALVYSKEFGAARITSASEPEAQAMVTDFRGQVLGVVVTDSKQFFNVDHKANKVAHAVSALEGLTAVGLEEAAKSMGKGK